ncbi:MULTISPECIES: class I SAM-dependent methyltransferase [Agrobacterium]|uniref:class I SAM-dependent methyltransferase n=1 Tax=Agrobacterium TaxID=357 RepID=UPI0009901C1B|nr:MULTISPECIES: class I SAM-dependent methyltransferase [Agrobacterium]PNQ26279.1 class I SAM-dependent methyltransferase [Rhizobium sp. YIC5082]MCZ7851599.1 class I SAM-dependent methyltransferase [Agrobacterium salinitolerans]MCZ7858233.1 class I SAM-dependent methyltransferase [Agrobacterium salinitolerans]MCZ7864409.1 class I SAM-dependent methyltransferase [Agrobacterium salinitolerans]MCZ7976535.1 class I SAM-dependent methyltransferase [Agrobacterium salinitolerans]
MNIEDRRFIFQELRSVEGYIDPPDALVFKALLQAQTKSGLHGGLAEIGVYYGRSYFLLRKFAQPQEKVLGVDLFDLDPPEDGSLDQYERLMENGRRLDFPMDENLIIKGDSTRLAPADITSRIGPARFFSIDGGHTLHHVLADAKLAMEVIAPHGVIVFDDTFNPAWPEVTVGVADFLRTHGHSLVCFGMTKYKTYVCHREFHATYAAAIAADHDLQALSHVETQFLGSKVVRLHNPMRRRVMYELMVRSGLGGFSERIYRSKVKQIKEGVTGI